MKKSDIVFLKPGSQKQIYGELSDFDLTAIEPPLWGALLAGYLRSAGYSVSLLDAEAEQWDYEEAARKVIEVNPILVCVVVSGTNPSASTMNMSGAGSIVRLIRQQNSEIKTVFIGLHPSALPERTLHEEDVDFVCQGEGFYSLAKLIDALKAKAKTFPIEGIWFREKGRIVSNPRPAVVENLDDIPQPAWDLLPMQKYRAHNWHCFHDIGHRQPYAILYTSLGCPFHCSFCCINSLFGKNRIRFRGIEAVMRELDFLVNTYGAKNIKIIDEMFAFNEKRVIELCDKIAERNYGLNIWAYARVNTVTEPMLAAMKKAGINWLAYGFESGSKRVIEDVTKGYKPEFVGKIVSSTRSHGFNICSNFIFGLPEDNFDSMNETFKLMIDINAEWANIYSAMAYPGSQLYEIALKNKWLLPEKWDGYSQYSIDTLPLPTKYITGGQVLQYRDFAFNTYYNNPRYLNMINKKFGPKTTDHIIQMSSRKLKRKFASI
jgi:radical SAM superfamily enzyme YgiQ (UPF0313 family)